MKILHLASFDGNIGDNASHMGFNRLMSEILPYRFTSEKLEIRKFYNNYSLPDRCYFDQDFSDKANQYDLLVIGGGGFLDFDIVNSVTGTTLNISERVLDSIKTPIFISSIGSNPRNNIPEDNIGKFRSFLDQFLARKNSFLAVRNDGSLQALRTLIGDKYADAIPQVLDHGFFYDNDGLSYRPTEKPYVLINTTKDQVSMARRSMDEIAYVNEMRKVVTYLLEETDLDVVFAPHIFGDIAAISDLLSGIDDFYIRKRVSITPYTQGDWGCNQIFSAYKNANLVLGMRFHANVCSLAMNVPTMAIAALDRVCKVYEDLSLSSKVFTLDKLFSQALIEEVRVGSYGLGTADYKEILMGKRNDSISLYRDFLYSIF